MKQHLLKNTYAAIVALFIAMMALPTTAQAQTKYDLKICGTQVTSDNCGDLSVIDGVEGTVKYDPDSKTLTLQNAKLNAEGYVYRIESNIDGLTIKVSGTNELNAEGTAIYLNTPATITGGGTLNAKSEGYAAIYAEGTNLTIKDCIVNAKGKWGIAGNSGSNEKLLIKNATVTAEGKEGSICDFKEITLEGCAITQPAGARFDEAKHAIVLNGEKVTSEVKIEPIVTKYDLSICGTQVTSGNCGDLSGIDGVEGTVKYDPNTKILTLKDAKLNTGGTCIYSEVDGLTIEVSGTNEVNAIESSAIYFYSAPATITGGGTLNVKSQEHCGIYASETNLTIKDCIVNAKGRWGIAGYNGSAEELLIKNATVTAEGKNGSICDFKEITLEDCAITQPAGAVVDNSQGAVVLNGEIVKSEVKIVQTKYDLKICGTQVTSDNCGDLSVIDGVEGTVSYDPDSKTLTLEGAKLNVEGDNFCIWSKIDGLTIKVSGTNELDAGDVAIFVYAPTTITGGGTLNAKSEGYATIYAYKTDLTIKDCIVNAKGNWGIAGEDGSKEKLLISKATVTAEGWNGSICDFKEITLEDCAITQPAGATFDESKHAIVLNGETVTSEVKIVQTKYDLWIAGTQVTLDNCGDLSAIDGVEGTVKYDPYSKTLTLEDARIKSTKERAGGRGIVNEIDGLTIRLVGDNIISTENSIGILNGHEKAITFTGEGKLRVNGSMRSTYDNCRGIDNYGTITITGCTLEASAGVGGLSGGKWKFDRCTVRAKGGGIEDHEQYGSIEWLNDKPEFIGCEIIAPKGTYWKEFKGATTYYSLFGEDDKVVTDWVTIADPTGINTPTIDTAAKQGIYTLSGVKLNGKVEDLPKGVYIVNGKKVMK